MSIFIKLRKQPHEYHICRMGLNSLMSETDSIYSAILDDLKSVCAG